MIEMLLPERSSNLKKIDALEDKFEITSTKDRLMVFTFKLATSILASLTCKGVVKYFLGTQPLATSDGCRNCGRGHRGHVSLPTFF